MRASFLALPILALPAIAGVQEHWWDITFVENANPDGLFPRRVVGVNGTWPPPPVDIKSTDSLIVHVTNSLDQVATLHHHGMFFNSSAWYDGAQGITECGIPPGAKSDYVIPINSSGQFGTYWVHSHSPGQYIDGLRGPLVIHPPKEVFESDAEFTVVLGDWYHQEHSVLITQFISTSNPNGVEPVPDSGLIYFAQGAKFLGPIPGRHPSPVTSAVGFNQNATLHFVPGKTYRLRIVNTSAFASFFFRIDGHHMRIIEVDGTDVKETPIDQIGIAVAQRYSVLVTARDDTDFNWVIHADMDTSMFNVVNPNLNPNITSSITYDFDAPLKNLGTVNAFKPVNDAALVPIVVVPQPKASTSINLLVNFDLMSDGTNRAIVNNVTFNIPLVPTILSELTLGPNATVQQAYGPSSFVLNHLEVFDLVIQNADTGSHPFHLHGHKFQIVGRSQDFTSSDPTLNPPIVEGQANPMRRDTILIPSGQSATLRVVADNPGTWFLHCHIEWHLEVGLAVQLIEAPLQAQQRNTAPASLVNNCKALGQPVSGNAAGIASTTNLTGLPVGPFPT
ncbi:ferroxidase [Phlegmacium glaucopus]|nr:ferroxidase [Phlegmacium glaucopus]